MEFPENLKYTRTHEWIQMQGNRARIGVTSFAAQELSDVVFVDLPETGRVVEKNGEVCVVESVKAASSIYAPAGGEVVAVNEALKEHPELLNQSCYTDGWIYELELAQPANPDQLLNAADYKKRLEEED
jgi:glycine cleavage system H protein